MKILLTRVAVIALCAGSLSAASAQDYEAPPVLRAADLLPPDVLSGDHHTVAPEVQNDGYMNRYEIRSEYGEFGAVGRAMLRSRVREIEALAALDNVSKTGVFLEAAADAGLKDIKVVVSVATRPFETLRRLPAGIGRLFRRGAEVVEDVAEAGADALEGDEEAGGEGAVTADEAQDAIEDLAGISAIERKWARELGVDPYTRNEVLKKAISQVAQVEFTARTGAGFAVPSVPGMTYVSGVNDAVWGNDAPSLKRLNQAVMTELGVDEKDAAAFLSAKAYTPSTRTVVLTALQRMEGTSGRDIVVAQASKAANPVEAWYFLTTVVLASWHHIAEAPIGEFVAGTGLLPMAVTEDGRALLVLAIDYLAWTEDVAAAADRFTALAAGLPNVTARDLWFGGRVSDRARAGLEARGWRVRENLIDRVDVPLELTPAGLGQRDEES